MEKLSVKTRDILLQAGWDPNNKMDVTKTVMFLEAMGYQVYDCVIDVLTVFGGMTYKFKHPDGSIETFHFCPEETVGDYYEKEDFEEFEARINEPLIIVGEAYRGYLIMLIAQSGKVFGKNASALYKFGDNIFEALDTLCLFKIPEEIN